VKKINLDGDGLIREENIDSEDDIYFNEVIESMVEDDEMSAEDAGFMQGYNKAR